MVDDITPPSAPQTPHHGILDKTLGEILHNNAQAQDMVMKAMRISPGQLQEMLQSAGNNQLMNMTIRDMFKNGIIQQAASGHFSDQTIQQGQAVKVTPEQMQLLTNAMQNGQQVTPEQFQQITGQDVQDGQMTQAVEVQPQKQSFLDKVKGFFK